MAENYDIPAYKRAGMEVNVDPAKGKKPARFSTSGYERAAGLAPDQVGEPIPSVEGNLKKPPKVPGYDYKAVDGNVGQDTKKAKGLLGRLGSVLRENRLGAAILGEETEEAAAKSGLWKKFHLPGEGPTGVGNKLVGAAAKYYTAAAPALGAYDSYNDSPDYVADRFGDNGVLAQVGNWIEHTGNRAAFGLPNRLGHLIGGGGWNADPKFASAWGTEGNHGQPDPGQPTPRQKEPAPDQGEPDPRLALRARLNDLSATNGNYVADENGNPTYTNTGRGSVSTLRADDFIDPTGNFRANQMLGRDSGGGGNSDLLQEARDNFNNNIVAEGDSLETAMGKKQRRLAAAEILHEGMSKYYADTSANASLAGHKMTNAYNLWNAQREQGNKDREYGVTNREYQASMREKGSVLVEKAVNNKFSGDKDDPQVGLNRFHARENLDASVAYLTSAGVVPPETTVADLYGDPKYASLKVDLDDVMELKDLTDVALNTFLHRVQEKMNIYDKSNTSKVGFDYLGEYSPGGFRGPTSRSRAGEVPLTEVGVPGKLSFGPGRTEAIDYYNLRRLEYEARKRNGLRDH